MATEPKEIIVEFLRNRVTDPRSDKAGSPRLTSTSDSFTGDGSTTTFTITPTSGSKVSHISSVTVGGTAQNKWEDYTFDPMFQSKVVTFTSAPADSSAIVVNYYEFEENNWVYGDALVTDLDEDDYPRMALFLVSGSGERMGVETSAPASVVGTEHYQLSIWTKKNYPYTISSTEVYSGPRLGIYLVRRVVEAFEDNIDDLYPKLWGFRVLNKRDGVWDSARQAFHTIVEFELSGESLGG